MFETLIIVLKSQKILKPQVKYHFEYKIIMIIVVMVKKVFIRLIIELNEWVFQFCKI